MEFFWFVVRFLAVTVGFTVLHGYVWWRLFRDTTRPGSRWRPIGAIGLGVLAAFGLAARFFVPSSVPMGTQEFLGWPGWIWFGIFMYLLGFLVVAEPLRWWLLRRHRNAENAETTLRAEPPMASAVPAEPPKAGTQFAPEPVAALAGTGPQESGIDPAAEPAAAESKPPPRKPDPVTTVPPESNAGSGPTRRRFVSRAIGLGVAVAATATTGYGLIEGYRTPTLKDVAVPISRLDRTFDGYRIAVVGDTHLSAIRGRGYCERVVDQINRTQPDLIAFVGDLASGEADQLRDATEPLARLASRDGAYFVAGNAEHYVGADSWYERVEELGMIPLPNTRVELPGFDLAGVNDLIVEQRHLTDEVGPDLEAALADRDPERASVLMAHQPDFVVRAVDWGVDLQLSGHTHGGQMWPIHILTRMRDLQVSGMGQYGDTRLYVTNGAGTNGPPMRVAAPPDITVMTLRSTKA
ncbi:metallophosphoesterase [Glycomyces buryatensis]|uniref:Metallophosphoesterase n=1 Tax=Glycomyces buryatensis TaxID=2570927 RepID=A0A4S8QHI0_9ACTN|nr:metallophosphoesterase [Glycomyces buryatensis]THV40144.1 metallophosphoesterase [Glycomyces buryatensis]